MMTQIKILILFNMNKLDLNARKRESENNEKIE
jgi:hypothetical protein